MTPPEPAERPTAPPDEPASVTAARQLAEEAGQRVPRTRAAPARRRRRR